jgi:hypothetical protein
MQLPRERMEAVFQVRRVNHQLPRDAEECEIIRFSGKRLNLAAGGTKMLV